MARPANVDSRETKKRILDSAAALFAAHGAGHASIRDVAKRAKVSVATVAFHFKDKDGLWDECVDAMYAEIAAQAGVIRDALAGGGSDQAKLRRAMEAVYATALEHRPAIRLLLRSVLETGEIGRRRREQALLPLLDLAASVLHARTGRPAGEIRLAVQSLIFLVGRYAVGAPAEIAAAVGVPASTPEKKLLAAVSAHLGDVAVRLLGGRR